MQLDTVEIFIRIDSFLSDTRQQLLKEYILYFKKQLHNSRNSSSTWGIVTRLPGFANHGNGLFLRAGCQKWKILDDSQTLNLRIVTWSIILFEVVMLIKIFLIFSTNRKKFGSGRIVAFPYIITETTILRRSVSI